jgi:TonB family protein
VLRTTVKKQKDNISAWHYLGLAFQKQGNAKEARKAFEKSAKLGDRFISEQLNTPVVDLGAIVSQFRKQITEAADSAEKYLELSSKLSSSKLDDWQERIAYLRDFVVVAEMKEASDSQQHKIFKAKEVTTKARILAKPEAQYTEEARRHQTTGTVVLRAVLATDGHVRGIYPISGLPHGLTRKAIKAARQIRFTPATFEGQPVMQFIQIEYNFNLY